MSQAEIALYLYPGLTRDHTISGPCGKALMALRYKGLKFRFKALNTPAEVRKINPRGRVPVLQIDGEFFPDSSELLDELERRYPEPPLVPQDRVAQLEMKLWEDWADEVLYFYAVYLRWIPDNAFTLLKERFFSRLSWPMRVLAPAVARRTVRKRALGQGIGERPEGVVRQEFQDALALLDGWLVDRDYLAGTHFSRADLSVAAMLDQIVHPVVPPALEDAVAPFLNLQAWRKRVLADAGTAAG